MVIPNGVYVAPFASAAKDDPRFLGTAEAPTIAFLGRLDEPRKGLQVLAAAIPTVLERVPAARFLIAGRGEAEAQRAALSRYGDAVTFLGGVSDAIRRPCSLRHRAMWRLKPAVMSFGIVLVEAMAAGTRVVASDLEAFSDVLDGGAYGALFRNGDGADLARVH